MIGMFPKRPLAPLLSCATTVQDAWTYNTSFQHLFTEQRILLYVLVRQHEIKNCPLP